MDVVRLEKCVALLVVALCIPFFMDWSIDLDSETGLWAVEVQNITIDSVLSPEFHSS
jgi:hypothetical protein